MSSKQIAKKRKIRKNQPSGRKLIVGNWKMNPTSLAEAREIFKGIKKTALTLAKTRTVICPPFIYLSELKKSIGDSKKDQKISVGSQDVSINEAGAHTGDVSAAMVKNIGAAYSIIGHSERRAKGETNEMVAKKVIQALDNGLAVILCVGEEKRTEAGEYLDFVKVQLQSALAKVSGKELKNITIAYEPVWAIGKREEDAMQPPQIHEMKIYIHKILNDMYKSSGSGVLAQKVTVLYGGSVTSGNAGGILSEGTIDGFLVGGKSLDPVDFGTILKLAEATR